MIKKTPLNDVHHKLEGQLTDFGGWEMPLWYKAGTVWRQLSSGGALRQSRECRNLASADVSIPQESSPPSLHHRF